ncbi:MAG: DUF1800 family protein [Actinomycetota bacterium]
MAELQTRDPDRARAAHLLRRATLRVDQDRIDRFAGLSWTDGVTELLQEAGNGAAGQVPAPDDDWGQVVQWWLEQMVAPGSGIAERLTWFWHTLLTTHAGKVGDARLVADQLTVLRANATGNYRELLHAFVTSGALLEFLDASWSMASNPNENLGRELMELFTIGPGNYTQDDVRAAARALAGWVVEDGEVSWRREHAFVAPLLFRGVQDTWDTTKIVDHLCDQPETAANIAAMLWHHLLGTELTPDGAAELGRWWQDQELEILPLVERILTDPAAADARLNRPRTGLEWYCAAHSALGASQVSPWHLEPLDQVPYRPPNVGGWPADDRWLLPGSLLGRLSLLAEIDLDRVAHGRSGTATEVLDRCGLYEISAATRAVIDAAAGHETLSPEAARLTTWRLALSSPEFQLA